MNENKDIMIAPEIPNIRRDVNGKPFGYIANNKVKSEGTVIAYTEDMVKEIIKCRNDIEYFAKNYYKIVHQDLGFVKIELRDYQVDCLKDFTNSRFNIVKFPRQSGKCVCKENQILIRNKKTGEIKKIPIGEFYEML